MNVEESLERSILLFFLDLGSSPQGSGFKSLLAQSMMITAERRFSFWGIRHREDCNTTAKLILASRNMNSDRTTFNTR